MSKWAAALLVLAGLLDSAGRDAVELVEPLREPVPLSARGPSNDSTGTPARETGGGEERGRRGEGRHRGAHGHHRSRFALDPVRGPLPVHVRFRRPPRAGVLFDIRTGEVLWERRPARELPIASLTKMMTALIVAERHRRGERVMITPEAAGVEGSGIGVLPEGARVRLEALLRGLLLVSGNDAAAALAQHDAGSVGRFVERMNGRARELGLRCSRFSSPHGLQDAGNYSCPRDLAALARAMLAKPRLGEIVGADHMRFRFPVKGGYLDLYNNNPFIRMGDESVSGVKTGYTAAAGRCYVITAHRDGRHLGVVLLDTPNPLEQVPALLEAGADA
jgi:serine-type D-Ala-D-Ala carboxypeptidase (penicillin-binding protein 5/6)